ncbi:MAG: aminoglycoside phosphotransferase family protein [Gammaproteobacteria bacterium]
MPTPIAPQSVLNAWKLDAGSVSPLGSGLINYTWLVSGSRSSPPYVLQQVNPVFPATVNDDIRVVTRHLLAAGLTTPELVPTPDGRWWVEDETHIYRLLTYIDGINRNRLSTPGEAAEAGALLAGFHRALGTLEHQFSNPRLGVHNTTRHLAVLRKALVDHAGHSEITAIRPLAQEILKLAAALPPIPTVPDRVVHGDPKVNNLLFDTESGRGLCLIDLDTLGPMPLPLELGDAFRSWCNPAGEDHRQSAFALDLFTGAVEGYAGVAAGWITADEIAGIVAGTLTIYVELAARFCADALRECYFGWDEQRFPSRSEHNQVRAASQLNSARALWDMRCAADEVVRRAFAPA